MLKKLVLSIAVAVLPLSIASAAVLSTVCTFTTTKTLKRGDTHQDILIMQRILNMDTATLIAKTLY
jgi:hypothetical protein